MSTAPSSRRRQRAGIVAGALLGCAVLPAVSADGPTRGHTDVVAGPDVTVVRAETRQWIQYRYGDRLLMIKVVPDSGAPFYLVPVTDCTEADAPGDVGCTRWRRADWITAPF